MTGPWCPPHMSDMMCMAHYAAAQCWYAELTIAHRVFFATYGASLRALARNISMKAPSPCCYCLWPAPVRPVDQAERDCWTAGDCRVQAPIRHVCRLRPHHVRLCVVCWKLPKTPSFLASYDLCTATACTQHCTVSNGNNPLTLRKGFLSSPSFLWQLQLVVIASCIQPRCAQHMQCSTRVVMHCNTLSH